jgi:hypothetical protein
MPETPTQSSIHAVPKSLPIQSPNPNAWEYITVHSIHFGKWCGVKRLLVLKGGKEGKKERKIKYAD